MNIEQELFSSYQLIKEKLLEYGFIRHQDVFCYEKEFMNGDFKAIITIDDKGEISGKVIEMEFDEEFVQIRIDSYKGGFVGEVREEYINILLDIRNKCFKKELFISSQANRLTKLISERYNEFPDFPFKDDKYQACGVFRYHQNLKWYGIIMNVNESFFYKDIKDEYVDVINVKVDEEKRDKIIDNKSIFPSYHMNKKKWISILLDDTLKDEKIMELIDTSRNLIAGKKKRKNNETMYYIQPCNPKFYDIDEAFICDNGMTTWKQSRNVNVGDICYMYIANPIGAVKYKCQIIEKDIPFEYKSKEVTINKLMKIKIIKKIDHDEINFKFLKSIGIPLIRGPVSIDKEIADKIDEKI